VRILVYGKPVTAKSAETEDQRCTELELEHIRGATHDAVSANIFQRDELREVMAC
jgi:hypothetical protein